MARDVKPLRWTGTSREDLRRFPEIPRQVVGHSLREAQNGGKAANAKPMEGFKGATVLKIVENHDGDTYRVVYTVKFEEALYVLHCFQKKSKSGIATPKLDLEMVYRRYKDAETEHEEWLRKKREKK